jgi:phosphinothricin acetyltransferase
MTAGLTVRTATVDDAGAIARIYNQGIEDRIATFETEPRTAAQIAEQLRGRLDTYPAVVAVSGDDDGARVVGFAWTSVYRPRACYAGVGEFSVYVDRESRGSGVGRALLDGLAAASRDRGFWKLVSRVFPENTASRGLCRACGFREVGVYRRHGQLDGVWRDVVIVELMLFDEAPR